MAQYQHHTIHVKSHRKQEAVTTRYQNFSMLEYRCMPEITPIRASSEARNENLAPIIEISLQKPTFWQGNPKEFD